MSEVRLYNSGKHDKFIQVMVHKYFSTHSRVEPIHGVLSLHKLQTARIHKGTSKKVSSIFARDFDSLSKSPLLVMREVAKLHLLRVEGMKISNP